jgi:hypothetical protein
MGVEMHNRPQFVTPVSAALFSPTAIGMRLEMDPLEAGQEFAVTVRNVGSRAINFYACGFGSAPPVGTMRHT